MCCVIISKITINWRALRRQIAGSFRFQYTWIIYYLWLYLINYDVCCWHPPLAPHFFKCFSSRLFIYSSFTPFFPPFIVRTETSPIFRCRAMNSDTAWTLYNHRYGNAKFSGHFHCANFVEFNSRHRRAIGSEEISISNENLNTAPFIPFSNNSLGSIFHSMMVLHFIPHILKMIQSVFCCTPYTVPIAREARDSSGHIVLQFTYQQFSNIKR